MFGRHRSIDLSSRLWVDCRWWDGIGGAHPQECCWPLRLVKRGDMGIWVDSWYPDWLKGFTGFLYNQNSNSSDIVVGGLLLGFVLERVDNNRERRLPAYNGLFTVIYYLPAWPKGSWRVKISGRQYEHIENLNRLKKMVQSVRKLLVTDTVLVAENVKLDLYWIVKMLYRNAPVGESWSNIQ